MNLLIPSNQCKVLQAAAIEVFPRESFGLLLGEWDGDDAVVTGVFIHQAVFRSVSTIILKDEPQHRIMDWFGYDNILGDWHSHPNEPPVLSRMKDFKNKKVQEMTDEWGMLHEPHMGDGHVAAITSVYPSIRKPGWVFKSACYHVIKGKIRKGNIQHV
jgi:proteasome lid subunit RPN8/RPN11